jgi:OOP family OmpA-OmpF porin
MGEAGATEATATRMSKPRVSEWNQLRGLLLGQELEQLQQLQERLENRTLRTVDIADVLPEALLLRARRDTQLRQALQPIFEEALIASVRKDPRLLAEALFPMIGSAIRRAVASALQNMVESLNQIVETSLTIRSVQWRIEAATTGKSYGEIALLRSLLYRVEQVFLIHRQTGLLLQHVIADPKVVRDPDMVSGMLTAIQDFVGDSFGGGEDTLENLRVGQLSVWIQHGPDAILAGVVRGTPPARLRSVFASALEIIHRDWVEQIKAFNGDAAPIAPVRAVLQTCLLGQSPEQRKTSWALFYGIVSVILMIAAAWLFVSVRNRTRWESYISALRREPGIVLTRQEMSGGRYVVSGLRDSLARDPAQLLVQQGIPVDKVDFEWEPYLSLAPNIAAQREVAAMKATIQGSVIRFPPGRSDLTDDQMDSVEALARQIQKLSQASAAIGAPFRLDVVGHTDDRGSEVTNSRLGAERASAVRAALVDLGVRADAITTRSAGAAEPVRSGNSERDRSLNRSVTFRVPAQTK